MIINANYYMDDATCSKLVEVLAPHIFKMSVRVVGYFFLNKCDISLPCHPQ